MGALLNISHLSVGYYPDLHILQDVSMAANEGAITAILGANGVGKSTLLKTVAGFLKPSHGTILMSGVAIGGVAAHRLVDLGVAYLAQDRGLFEYMTVEENLRLGAWTFRRNKKLVNERLAETFDRFSALFDKRHHLARELSGGEQRMIEISRSLMVDPRLLLVDEPTAGLSPRLSDEVYDTLDKLRSEGRTIVLVEQEIRWALQLADYVYILDLGRNRLDGPPSQFNDLKKTFWW